MHVQAVTTGATRDEIEALVREHFRIVAEGEREAMDHNVTADFLNIRSAEEPLAARQPGRAGLRAPADGCGIRSANCVSRSTTS
jgi:hypothetical protein